MHQPGRYIAAIPAIDFHQRVMPFVQLKQRPFSGIPVQVRHPFSHQRGRSIRNKHFEAFHQYVRRLRLPAHLEPQNAKG